jgi:hypothetical protein
LWLGARFKAVGAASKFYAERGKQLYKLHMSGEIKTVTKNVMKRKANETLGNYEATYRTKGKESKGGVEKPNE